VSVILSATDIENVQNKQFNTFHAPLSVE